MKKSILITLSILGILLLSACTESTPEVEIPETPPTGQTDEPALPSEEVVMPTDVLEPSFTPIPTVAWVNGEAIPESLFQPQLNMLLAVEPAFGSPPTAEEAEQLAIDNLISTMLLAQGARENGFQLTPVQLEESLADLVAEAGGQEAFAGWLSTYGYTEETFRLQFSLELEAAAMRQILFDNVPLTQPHLEAHDFLFADEYSAQRTLDQLVNGAEYETILTNNDPESDGYMAWFPRGYIFDLTIEEAAFSVEAPGFYGAVIENEIGYHVIYVLDTDPSRQVSPNALLELKEKALLDWLEEKTAQSSIEILLP